MNTVFLAVRFRTYQPRSKTATLVPEFALTNLPFVELQPWCLWAEHSDDDEDTLTRRRVPRME